jgi:hypothetical protein
MVRSMHRKTQFFSIFLQSSRLKGPILSTKHERVPAHPNLLGGEGTAAMDAASRVSIGLFGVVPINSDVPSAYLNSNKSLLKGDA